MSHKERNNSRGKRPQGRKRTAGERERELEGRQFILLMRAKSVRTKHAVLLGQHICLNERKISLPHLSELRVGGCSVVGGVSFKSGRGDLSLRLSRQQSHPRTPNNQSRRRLFEATMCIHYESVSLRGISLYPPRKYRCLVT